MDQCRITNIEQNHYACMESTLAEPAIQWHSQRTRKQFVDGYCLRFVASKFHSRTCLIPVSF